MKKFLIGLVLVLTASVAQAATLVSFTDPDVSATASISLSGNTLTGSLTNTSAYNAILTGFAFDFAAGNAGGFAGTDDNVFFDFTDGNLGNVAQYNGVILDFGYITGNNFNGGDPQEGLLVGQTIAFLVTGPFAVTEAQLASGMYARFQNVGFSGEGSDVTLGVPGVPVPQITSVPEPASMLLLGTGLLALARKRFIR